ncbi:hypothetical protein [Photobacterium leiognathi]|uniref:hypothetical protein n=1 Tax=Photobacterium leiognathi TaxID=553611 RepID=UPI003F756EFE
MSCFTLPEYTQPKGYVLTVTNSERGKHTLASSEWHKVLQDRVDELVEQDGISLSLFFTDIHAKDEVKFTLSKISCYPKSNHSYLSVSEENKWVLSNSQ